MDDLPLVEIAGLIRPQKVSLLREVAVPLEPPDADAEPHFDATASGSVAIHWEGRPEVVLWDPRSNHLQTHDLQASGAGWQGLDATGQTFAVANGPSLRLLSRDGDVRREHHFEGTVGSPHCRFAADGSLWHLTDNAAGCATLRLLDASGELRDAVDVTHAASEGPARWLEGRHPAKRVIPIGAGMGQDGAFYQMASERDGIVLLDQPVDDLCFAGWAPSGEVFATLPHYGDLLCVSTLDGSVCWERDLGPVFDALDDGDNWQVHFVDNDRVLIPTNEGRLLMVSRHRSEVIEVRLDGDERNWDWAHVQLGPANSLITARVDDRTLRVWDLSGAHS